ncbi:S4 domain protein [Eubacterium saphenum ATCC 49989]|nr:S4 domain protein [Eubacterium saphenum ATCC 49989]
MRIDKFLKNSRIIKRRTLAKEACEKHRILLNDRIAKPGTEVNVGDIITLKFAAGEKRIKVLDVSEHVSKASSLDIYEEL